MFMGVAGRAFLQVLSLEVLLAPAGCLQPRPGWRFASYEVVIPWKVPPQTGVSEGSGKQTYILYIEGQKRVVHLKVRKLWIPRHLPVFTYNDQEVLTVDLPFIPDDCHYQGVVEGIPESMVALSTCSGGLRGMLKLENLTYEIEPLSTTITFQHLIYRLEEVKDSGLKMKCATTDEELSDHNFQGLSDIIPKTLTKEDTWSPTRFVELAVVVDHERFIFLNQNKTKVVEQVLNIVHMTDILYDPLRIHVFLVGLEIWTQGNLIDIIGPMGTVALDFQMWQQKTLPGRLQYDTAHLIVFNSYGIYLGLGYVGNICSENHAIALLSFTDNNLILFAALFAHELGHNLGMHHDVETCSCKGNNCIMNANIFKVETFSNCSYNYFYKQLNSDGHCLADHPEEQQVYFLRHCGNRVVEKGEQCDCGSEKDCKQDHCCQSNCRLSPGANCAFGHCCKDCKVVAAGQLCRAQISNCDLPEYCNGVSPWCPADTYVLNGSPCGDGAFCYEKYCRGLDQQCKSMFGRKAKSGSLKCFKEINMEGDRFGNCGFFGDKYMKCAEDHILCGRLLCENVTEIPVLKDFVSIFQINVDGTTCWGMDYHFGRRGTDFGEVKDGTRCGPKKMCKNKKCVNIPEEKNECNATKCHGRGLCNHNQNCHCLYGWNPPYCNFKGYGGSIDSGPAPKKKFNKLLILYIGITSIFLILTITFLIYFESSIRAMLFNRVQLRSTDSSMKI
ncbi:disintegrin and metalloproteinase domain-containing protein 21-like [Sminthopsis crassicaudata]|uniref:disintegrin and metalloproteinase domain-containing protein 21-like n=1 Tax=Sminthopsis crassicaudata TaxID=9301 RepID=UPI003D6973AB